MEHVVWGISGAAARAIGIFQAAKVAMEKGLKPTYIIGQSSGAILTPIIAASYKYPKLIDKAIEMAETLDITDMFPHRGNFPFNKKGKLSSNAKLRILTGHNHFAWQDIGPMFKHIFKEKHLQALKESGIVCYSFCVKGSDGSTKIHMMNRAESVDELLQMIKESDKIVPFVQNENGYIDGGFACYNPGWTVLQDVTRTFKVKQYVSIYAREITPDLGFDNKQWDKSIFTTTSQAMLITTHWLGNKDAIIEQLLCEQNEIDYVRIECPNGYTDEVYETDDKQLKALGLASKAAALQAFDNQMKK